MTKENRQFEEFLPSSLLELSDTEVDDLSLDEQQELIELVLIESKETIKSLYYEVDQMDEKYYSLDSFYEIQAVIAEYHQILSDLNIDDESFNKFIDQLTEKLNNKNPIYEIAQANLGQVLVHSSDITSLYNLLQTKVDKSEVCTTAGSLQEKNDIFRPKKKSIHAGIIFDPQDATRYFSKDVGSHRSRGRRVLEDRFKQYEYNSLQKALDNKEEDKRVEAWIDTQQAKPKAILLIDPSEKDRVIDFADKYNLPVLYNSHLYEI